MSDIKKTLGGDRLGSGNRMKQEMHNFYRSNHNLSCTRASTMTAGVLYPMYTNVALKGDTFDIDLSAFVRTIPTEGPLFGSFKLQADVFQVPFRLYQAILHNNTTEIGMDMNQVLIPKVKLHGRCEWNDTNKLWEEQISRSALANYLGVSGICTLPSTTTGVVERKFNAIPFLGYYDIFKNYYANKQEENAYVISKNKKLLNIEPLLIISTDQGASYTWDYNTNGEGLNKQYEFLSPFTNTNAGTIIKIEGKNLRPEIIFCNFLLNGDTFTFSIDELKDVSQVSIQKNTKEEIVIRIRESSQIVSFTGNSYIEGYSDNIELLPFKLSNIDDMRKNLLTKWELGEEFVLEKGNNESDFLPYSSITDYDQLSDISFNSFANNGLVVKTYQSDMFNNWLDTEWVNKITELSKISTTSGGFTIDALNFAKKVYNHYNRIAISGGTYDDWQEATYGDKVWGKSEKPIYCGGFSSEVVFDEVVSTAATIQDDVAQPLGTLGGRGSLTGDRGGHVIVKVNEASMIMVIVSLTPRITYTQGNAWYMTEIESIDDLHKPMFDRIGFQDLLVENMAWYATRYISTQGIYSKPSAGKQPAWIHYMTDVNKAYGGFAEPNGSGFMILQRQYGTDAQGNVKDVTTYIDPTKYNYAFAYTELDSQNFWTFLKLNIKARRKMSATQIPNL